MTTGRINQGAIRRSARERERIEQLVCYCNTCANGSRFVKTLRTTRCELCNSFKFFNITVRFCVTAGEAYVHCVVASILTSNRISFKFNFLSVATQSTHESFQDLS
jgi:hypothetical protein